MSRLKKNYIYNLLLQVSKVIFPLITAPYIARVLDPDGVGLFNFVNTFTSYFALLAALGVPTYGIREVSKIREDIKRCEHFISQMLSLEVVTTILSSLVYIGVVFAIGKLSDDYILFLIAGITIYITPFKIEWYFSGKEEFGYITFRSLIIKTISVILLFFVVKEKSDIGNYILLNVFANIANEVWNYIKLLKQGIRPYITFSNIKEHVNPVLVLFVSSLAISVYIMLDTVMLGFLSTYEEVGYYNSAMHVLKALLPITTAIATVAIPQMAIMEKEGRTDEMNRLVNRSFSIISFLSFPIAIGIVMVSSEFVPLFFGGDYTGAVVPMQIGSVIVIIIGFNILNGNQILVALSKEKYYMRSVLCGAVSNFILNSVLIPKYGAAGATISSVCAEFLILIINEVYVRKYTKVRIMDFSDMLKSIGGALLVVPICLIMQRLYHGWTYVVVCIVICSVMYVLFEHIVKNKMLTYFQAMLLKKKSF